MRNYQAMERVKEFIGDQEYFTTRQAGTILGVSKAQVQRWIADGKLNIGEHKKASHIKIAQYDLLHFIAENHYEEYVLNLPNSFTVPELCKKVGLTRKWYYESLGEDKVAQPLHSPIRMKRIKYEDVRRIYENNANDLSKRERADFLKKLEAAYNVKVKNTQVCAGVTKIVMGGNGKNHPDYSLDMEEGVTDEGIPDNETGGVPDVVSKNINKNVLESLRECSSNLKNTLIQQISEFDIDYVEEENQRQIIDFLCDLSKRISLGLQEEKKF